MRVFVVNECTLTVRDQTDAVNILAGFAETILLERYDASGQRETAMFQLCAIKLNRGFSTSQARL